MSVLKTLSSKDGWIDVEPPGDDAGPNTIGVYDGENVNYGFRSNDEGETIEGDEYRVYQSGPYTLEVRIDDDDNRQVQVSTTDVGDRTYSTKPMKNADGSYDINLPTRLVRHLGYDRVVETGTREVEGEDVDVVRGIPVEITTQWAEDGLEFVVEEADEDELDRPEVRRIQHKKSGNYMQYVLYFPLPLIPMFGLDSIQFEWRADDGRLIALIESVESNGERVSVSGGTNIEGLANAPILAQPFRYETFEGDPRAVDTVEVDDMEIGIKEKEETFADTDDEERVISITSRGKNDQLRFLLPDAHSRGLGIIPDRKPELVRKENRPSVVWLAEWTPDGLVYILHTAPDELPEERQSKQTRVSLAIDNWTGTVTDSDTLADRYEKAGNQVGITYPKSAGFSTGIVDEDIYWWPTVDEYYGTGAPILVGRPVSDIAADDEQESGEAEVEAEE